MDVVWIKLTTVNSGVVSCMFGTGGIVSMEEGTSGTGLFSATMFKCEVQESIDEIMTLIGSARNGVKVGAEKT